MLRITSELLSGLENFPLFYPHSGRDWLALREFSPFLSELHFADRDYFRDDIQKQTPVFGLASPFRLQSMEFANASLLDEKYAANNWIMRDREACTRIETYTYRGAEPRRHEFRVFLHGQNSLAVFESLPPIGVFFYRGDSSEGGNVAWLSVHENQNDSQQPAMLGAVLEKLVSGGLLITDGSRIDDEHSPVAPIKQFFGQNVVVERHELPPFEALGRRFEFLGTLTRNGFRGPTLVWRII